MNLERTLNDIAQIDFNRTYFVKEAVRSEPMRNFLVDQLLQNPDIMVYYHCYEILDQATESNPEVFYCYWESFATLLRQRNSYLRNAGLSILSNLCRVDQQKRIESLIDEYLGFLADIKFLTACYCVDKCAKIIVYQPQLAEKIINALLSFEQKSPFTEKQNALLVAHIVEVFDKVYCESCQHSEMLAFARHYRQCNSPKARKVIDRFLQRDA